MTTPTPDSLSKIARRVELVRDTYNGIGVFSAHDLTRIAADIRALDASDRRDAERYRHIKSDTSLAWICLMRREPDEWDAEIDAALAKESKP